MGLGVLLTWAVLDGREVSAQDEFYVGHFNGNSVTVYPRTANGNQPPVRKLFGGQGLPVTLLACQTVPATGQCMAPPAPSVALAIAPEATLTFAIFAIGRGVIDFDPARNRVTVHFSEGAEERGSTAVAIRIVAAP